MSEVHSDGGVLLLVRRGLRGGGAPRVLSGLRRSQRVHAQVDEDREFPCDSVLSTDGERRKEDQMGQLPRGFHDRGNGAVPEEVRHCGASGTGG